MRGDEHCRPHRAARRCASAAPQKRSAALATASSTGCTSVGDCEITPQDLGGGGLLLQRLASSVNSRTFSMAITAWAAKVSSSSICCGVKGPGSGLRSDDGADGCALAHHRRGDRGAEAVLAPSSTSLSKFGRIERLRRRADVHGSAIENGPAAGAVSRSSGRLRTRRCRQRTLVRGDRLTRRRHAWMIGIASRHRTHRRLDHCVEHRLDVGRRLRDRAAGCRQSPSAAPATSSQLVEQPHVLDGDHGLVGEGLQQQDLAVGEGAGFASRKCDRRRSSIPRGPSGTATELARAAHERDAAPPAGTMRSDRRGRPEMSAPALARVAGPSCIAASGKTPSPMIAAAGPTRARCDLSVAFPKAKAWRRSSRHRSVFAALTKRPKTGVTSVGDLQITRRISAVAVCLLPSASAIR